MQISDATLRALSGYRLQRAAGTAMLGYKKVFALFGLRRTTFSGLSVIVENPGLRQSQLAQTLAIERPNLVQVVEDLVKRELITREVSAQDARAYALRPTPKGQALFAKALAAVQALDLQVSAGMSAQDIEALHDALDRIETNSKSITPP